MFLCFTSEANFFIICVIALKLWIFWLNTRQPEIGWAPRWHRYSCTHMIAMNTYTGQVLPCPTAMAVELPSLLTMSDLAVTRVSTAVKSWAGFCWTAWVFSGTLVSCSLLTDHLRHQNVAIYHLLSCWFTFRVRQVLTSQLCRYCHAWAWIRRSYKFLLSWMIFEVLSGNLPA